MVNEISVLTITYPLFLSKLSSCSSNVQVNCFKNHQLLPSTSMTAHAMDEFEVEERGDMIQMVPAVIKEEAACLNIGFPIPLSPLPLYSQNNYSQVRADTLV